MLAACAAAALAAAIRRRDEAHRPGGEDSPGPQMLRLNDHELVTSEDLFKMYFGATRALAEEASTPEASSDQHIGRNGRRNKMRGSKNKVQEIGSDHTTTDKAEAAACTACGDDNNCCNAGGSWYGLCPEQHSWEAGNAACLKLLGKDPAAKPVKGNIAPEDAPIRIIGEGADEYDEQSHGGKEEQANGR